MTKVLLIIPSLNPGGAERILVNILNQIDLSRYEIDLFVGVSGGVLEKDIPDSVQITELFGSRLFSRISSYIYRKFGFTIGFDIAGRRIIKSYDMGISYLDGSFSQFLFSNSSNEIAKKSVVIHSSYLSFSNVSQAVNSPHFYRMKSRYERVDTIVTVSHESKKEFEKMFGGFRDIRVIYNPQNVNEVIEKSKLCVPDFIGGHSIVNFSIIGSLVQVKGHQRLLNVLKRIKDEGIMFKLQIIGDGPLMKSLKQQVKELRLDQEIEFCGYQANPYFFIAQSDFIVISSFSEGLPTVLCEALILGKPTVATDITGCREVLKQSEYGLLTPNCEEGLYDGIKKMILDVDLRTHYSNMAVKRSEIFDDKVAIYEYDKLFKGV